MIVGGIAVDEAGTSVGRGVADNSNAVGILFWDLLSAAVCVLEGWLCIIEAGTDVAAVVCLAASVIVDLTATTFPATSSAERRDKLIPNTINRIAASAPNAPMIWNIRPRRTVR